MFPELAGSESTSNAHPGGIQLLVPLVVALVFPSPRKSNLSTSLWTKKIIKNFKGNGSSGTSGKVFSRAVC